MRIGRLFGIPLGIDLSWLPMALLITATLARNYFPVFLPRQSAALDWSLALAAMILLFACLVAHELAHALTARNFGIGTAQITLFMFGGVAMMRSEPQTPKAEFWIAVAGPAMSFALALLAGLLSALGYVVGAPPAFLVMTQYMFAVNLVFAVFNLLPAFPMDGGRVLRALLWRRSRDLFRATRWATLVSQTLAGGAILWGVSLVATEGLRFDTVWPILIGGFVFLNARRVYLAARDR